MRNPTRKIVTRAALAAVSRRMAREGERLVFTNGCFDLMHLGHVRLLSRARRLGDALAVGLNSDTSVRKLKGPGRPILKQKERAEILAALECVDFVVVFSEPTPQQIIRAVRPKVLVKGGDWSPSRIVGRATVEADGGEVRVIPLQKGFSTTAILRRILSRRGR
ncbi:MAG: D-glycero-beta-D-manno-heptose 1-phosphate adenylyltransferase [Acidobacteria bacterium]|nr:D-glycero-beta-D-manno-heptose 1-phosphate adenylyltransferase [Acidobacteriota bacterium]MCI0568147.1 D-glycero-beta-D-manno-heptose 1-phosphate adenylyltransferase [Acidobacteriota bacterium]